MAENTEQLELEVADEAPKEAVQVASPDEELIKIKAELADRDAKAKASQETAEAERRARVAAEQRIAEREQENATLRAEAITSKSATVESALTALQHQQEAAKSAVKTAFEAADGNAMAEAQAKLADVSARMVEVERIKATPAPQHYVPQVRQADPIEGFLSKFSPVSQAWLRQNKDNIVSDGNGVRLSPKAMSAHYAAEAEGLTAETPEYFKFIEQKLNPPADDEVEIEDAAPQRRSAPVSAPVSRETNNNKPATKNTRIRLTPQEAEAAEMSGLSPLDYYNNKQALIAEGKLGRTQH
jgi:hypothetical protein